MMNGNLLCSFTPSILPCVSDLAQNTRLGICSGSIEIFEVRSGCPSTTPAPNCDRFKIRIPYAGQSLTWDILFIGNNASHPPDFAFDDKSFFPEPKQIKSLMNWNEDDPQTLRHLIEELYQLYRMHQVALVNEYSRLQFEYSSLMQLAEFCDDDVEILVNKKNRQGMANFLIKLPVDFSKIPPAFLTGNPGDDSAVLLTTFHSLDGSRITPQLFLSPRVEQALGGSSNLRIPAFPIGGCLENYVPNVNKLLQNKVEQIESGFEKRKEYFASFLSYFGLSVIECDVKTLSKLCFLFVKDEFHFIIQVTLPLYFPQEKPVFLFQSIYHVYRGRPYSTICQDYPYSPRWSGDEMAERARNYINDYIPTFMKASVHCTRL